MHFRNCICDGAIPFPLRNPPKSQTQWRSSWIAGLSQWLEIWWLSRLWKVHCRWPWELELSLFMAPGDSGSESYDCSVDVVVLCCFDLCFV
jgi:hypothetical protein